MGRLAPIKQFINQSTKMSPSVFLLCFLAMGAIVHAEEEEWEVGLSAEEIMSTEFEEEYSGNERSIDEIIEAAGTESGAKEDAANNQAINFDMEMLRDLLELVWPMIGTDGQRISSLTRSRLGIFQVVRCKSFMLA